MQDLLQAARCPTQAAEKAVFPGDPSAVLARLVLPAWDHSAGRVGQTTTCLCELVLSCHMDPGDCSQAIRLGTECPYPRSRLTSSHPSLNT